MFIKKLFENKKTTKENQTALPSWPTDFDFAALDVETANPNFDSICAIGIAFFKENKVIETSSDLIDPQDYFDLFNVTIHGITPEMVKGKLTFPQIHYSLGILLSERIVVHHTAFDRTSITQACEKYGLPQLNFHWLDSARVARRQWSDTRNGGYGLADLASALGVEFKHHDPTEDARAAGEILLKAIAESNLSLEEWRNKAYQKIKIDWTDHAPNPDGPLFGEKICFTGALSITRDEAAAIAASIGCEIELGVTRHTTILVVGDQNSMRLAGFEKSTKHRKAEELAAKGRPIRIIGENDFNELIKIA